MVETSHPVAVRIHPLFPTTNAEEPVVSVKNSEGEQAELRDKLILAAELPSAAEALAELFPDEGILAGAVANMESACADPTPACAEVNKEAAQDSSDPPPAPQATSSSSNWALEEALANHKEWVESQGTTGKRADFSGARLEGADLISVNFRLADLSGANLKGVDLLLADLREACLARANLQEACLVGANLEGANLEGASLETAMGLVPRQLAGANLHEATLPPQLLEFGALVEFEQASRRSMRLFGVTLSLSLLSWLIIWVTRDVQLLGDTAIIPFLHSPAAAVALPTVECYLIAPVLLCIFYLVFLFHLQRLWDSVLELPAIFPDGRALGSNGPRIVLGLLRTHFHWMNQDPPSTRAIEKAISVLLAYWIVPPTLLLYWARYLTLQEIHGTILHELLAVVAAGVALHATIRIGRPMEKWTTEGKCEKSISARLRSVKPLTVAIALAIMLTFVSVGVFLGVPRDASRGPQFGPANIRRWVPTAFSWIGFDPFANLTEAVISNKPAGWTGDASQVSCVKGARLNNTKFRYAQAYGVFLVNAHLWRSDFEGSFLSQADMRGADLSQSNLRFATMDRVQLNHANLDRANLDGANLARADLRDANLSYATLADATLVDARLDGASFYGAKLPSANLVRASLERVDLRSAHLEDANLEHADFQQAYLWATALPGANLKKAQLQTGIFIDADLRGADLREAQFSGTVLNGADLSGSNLDGADLRGALQLSANQICSAKSRQGTLLDEAMQTQVDAQCVVSH
jgi:uncharacterized protein YjbI with pentapeptide repeats